MEHRRRQEQDGWAVLSYLHIHEPQPAATSSGARQIANLPAHRLPLPVGGLQQLGALLLTDCARRQQPTAQNMGTAKEPCPGLGSRVDVDLLLLQSSLCQPLTPGLLRLKRHMRLDISKSCILFISFKNRFST